MLKSINNSVLDELKRQNPWWQDPPAAPLVSKVKRDLFSLLKERILHRELITSLIGLRRVGKSTLLFQIIEEMFHDNVDPKSILYFSFEELPGRDLGDALKGIIDHQIDQNLQKKSYLFLDEIQYVNNWNSILKHYFDLYPQLKFTITGSASLFIGTSAHESLAGRIQELVLRPMGYGEYLRLNSKENTSEHFMQYLAWGEFPYLEKLPDWAEKKEYVNEFIMKKVVENDLPRLKKVYGHDLYHLLNMVIARPGQQIEIQNLALDIGISQNTVREYLSLLEKTNLISQLFNVGIGFRTRSVRQRKIYSWSVNSVVLKSFQGLNSDLWQRDMGLIVETFVHNYLLRTGNELFFWRQRQIKEVDFIQVLPEGKFPIEVKYQNEIRPNDLQNLVYYCKKEHLKKAMVITKNEDKIVDLEGVEIVFRPATQLL
ncbi:MAG: ATP-binding protein [Candidatus Gottesmanbacteria bacterium]|nr:ATP-binding protein [Candidatus Gottesmanbacteria bacterium]